ncbi:MAG TPA: hypothetical protein VF572_06470 [Candidatus Saccharimonadales bacterium]
MIANKVMLSVLVIAGVAIGLAISFAISLTPVSYGPLSTPVQTTETITTKAQTVPHASTLTVVPTSLSRQSIQVQQSTNVTDLQPAQNTIQNATVTANSLQPSNNSIQLTGTNIQNAEVVLQ